MSTHIRRVLLLDLKAQLKALPNYGGVWIQRVQPKREGWPAITLFADNENVETLTVHASPRPQGRTFPVVITIWFKGSQIYEKTEADYDGYALDVEKALTKPVNADDMTLLSTEFQFAEDDPDIHAVTLTYNVSYSSVEFSPGI